LDAFATAVETIVPLSDALLQEARVGAFKDLLATLKGKKEDVKKKKVTHADSDSSLLPAATSNTAIATVKSSRTGLRREALKRGNRASLQQSSPAAAAAPSSTSPSSSSSSSRSSSRSSSLSSYSPRSSSSSTDDGSDSDSDHDSDSDSAVGLDMRDSSQMSSNLTDALGDSHRVRGASRTGLKPVPPAKPPVSTLSMTVQTQTDAGSQSETHAQIQSHTSGEPVTDVELNRNAERIMRREMDLAASKEKEKDMESRIAALCKELEIERFRCKEAVAEVRLKLSCSVCVLYSSSTIHDPSLLS
jgi:hypothetical protein